MPKVTNETVSKAKTIAKSGMVTKSKGDDISKVIKERLMHIWDDINREEQVEDTGIDDGEEMYDTEEYINFGLPSRSNVTSNARKNVVSNVTDANCLISNSSNTSSTLQLRFNPIDTFFSLMSNTVKSFTPEDQNIVKNNVFSLINQIEAKQLKMNSNKTEEKLTNGDCLPKEESDEMSETEEGRCLQQLTSQTQFFPPLHSNFE